MQVVVMKVAIHCQGCAGKVRKHISKMEGMFVPQHHIYQLTSHQRLLPPFLADFGNCMTYMHA